MTLTDLSDQISPFPDAGNVLYTNRSSSPLRKLRPIRSIGDSPTKLCSGSSSPAEVPITGASSSSMELMDANPRMGPLWEIVAKKLEQLEENQNAIPDPVEIANMLVAMHTNSTSFPRFQQEDDYDAEAEAVETLNKCKRKRRGFTKLELVLLNMMDKVMKKQEEMHNQLIQIIDKHDKDRIAREEAWRLQELERQERDNDLRQEQTARTLALISFIENLLGKQIDVSVSVSLPQAAQPKQHHVKRYGRMSALSKSKEECDQQPQAQDSAGNRWPESQVKALITYRTAMDDKFKSSDIKHNIWEEVSIAMASAGYIRDAKKCKEKWENINKYFKKTVGRGKRPKSSKTCPYFHELDALYKNGILNLGSPLLIEMKKEAESCEQRQ